VDHESECDYVYSFVEEAEAHKDEAHHLQAFAMESEIFGRNCECDKALEACTDLRKKYEATAHSAQLVNIYGEDYCAQCIAQSARWHLELGKGEKAKEACDYVLNEILPNFFGHNKFLVLYPILWVLKDTSQAERACRLCREYLVVSEADNKDDGNGSDSGEFMLNSSGSEDDEEETPHNYSPFQKIYKPITMLMELTAGVNEESTVTAYAEWALDTSNSDYDRSFNTYTANVGRNADSIVAEVCLLLAIHGAASPFKIALMARASSLVAESMKVSKYLPLAHAQVKAFAFDKKFKGL